MVTGRYQSVVVVIVSPDGYPLSFIENPGMITVVMNIWCDSKYVFLVSDIGSTGTNVWMGGFTPGTPVSTLKL